MSQNNLIYSNNFDYDVHNDVNNVSWIIDRTPDYNLINYLHEYNSINNIQINHPIYEQYVQNRYFEQQFAELTEQLRNGTIQFNIEIDDFIPFEPVQHEPIQTTVQKISVTEEERNCCICFELKETTDISQINCGHKFCGSCVIQHISRNTNESSCPLCREKITHITFQDEHYQSEFNNINLSPEIH